MQVISAENGWSCADAPDLVELDEATSLTLKNGNLVFSLLHTLRDIEDEKMMQYNGKTDRIYNWNIVFNRLEKSFGLYIEESQKEAVLNGDVRSMLSVVEMLRDVISPAEPVTMKLKDIRESKSSIRKSSKTLPVANLSPPDVEVVVSTASDSRPPHKRNSTEVTLWDSGELDSLLYGQPLTLSSPAFMESLNADNARSGAAKIADNVLDLLSISYAFHIEVGRESASEMIVNQTVMLLKCADENMLLLWYRELKESVEMISKLVVKQPAFATLVMDVFGVGLSAVNIEIVQISATTLNELAAMWNLGSSSRDKEGLVSFAADTWDWFIHSGLARVLAAYAIQTNAKTLTALFRIVHNFGSIAYIPLFEGFIKPMLRSPLLYFTFASDFLDSLSDTILAQTPELVSVLILPYVVVKNSNSFIYCFS